DLEIRIAHEAVAKLPRGAFDAGLQIVVVPIEAIARIAHAPAKRREDRKVRTRTRLDFRGIVIAPRDVEHVAPARDLQAQERSTVTGNPGAMAAGTGQHHDGLIAELCKFRDVSGHDLSC